MDLCSLVFEHKMAHLEQKAVPFSHSVLLVLQTSLRGLMAVMIMIIMIKTYTVNSDTENKTIIMSRFKTCPQLHPTFCSFGQLISSSVTISTACKNVAVHYVSER